jgi:hypothetical protein
MKSKLYGEASLGPLECNVQLVSMSSASLRLRFLAVEVVVPVSKAKFMSVDVLSTSLPVNPPSMVKGSGGQCSKSRYDNPESSGSEFQYSSAVDAMGMNENHVKKVMSGWGHKKLTIEGIVHV